MDLVIIEGYGKLKTISSYLGKDYKVIATGGHIRDLISEKNNVYGVDFNTFELTWRIIDSDKAKVIKDINKYASDANIIYIATDPDREGEAIAYHIKEVLKQEYKNKTVRIKFNEISKSAIFNAIKRKGDIDLNLVNAQFTRRIYDRYFGFSASDIVQRALRQKSAGRVQSVALVILEKRMQEIENYIPKYSYSIENKIKNLKIKLVNENNEVIIFESKNDAQNVLDKLSSNFILNEVIIEEQNIKKPQRPFTTSQLQKVAGSKFKYGAESIENVLQHLYQGIEINGEHLALISYPRTDSSRISEEFNSKASNYVHKNFAREYWNDSYWFNELKQKESVQDGHEALRVIDFEYTPEKMKLYLNEMQYNIYNLIYYKTLECYLAFSIYKKTTFKFNNNDYVFVGVDKVRTFAGYEILNLKLDAEELEESSELKQNESYVIDKDINWIKEHVNKKPTLFSQAELIDYLEKKGIGRPSTYASMAKVNIKRGYAKENSRKQIYLLENGRLTARFEIDKFKDTISESFTGDMEHNLDLISRGLKDWKEYLLFLKQKVDNEINLIKIPKKEVKYLERVCPKCGLLLVDKEKSITCKNYFWDFNLRKNIGKCDYVEWKTTK
ncbi:DNA topoisomerase [Mycoplasma sp. 4423]